MRSPGKDVKVGLIDIDAHFGGKGYIYACHIQF